MLPRGVSTEAAVKTCGGELDQEQHLALHGGGYIAPSCAKQLLQSALTKGCRCPSYFLAQLHVESLLKHIMSE